MSFFGDYARSYSINISISDSLLIYVSATNTHRFIYLLYFNIKPLIRGNGFSEGNRSVVPKSVKGYASTAPANSSK